MLFTYLVCSCPAHIDVTWTADRARQSDAAQLDRRRHVVDWPTPETDRAASAARHWPPSRSRSAHSRSGRDRQRSASGAVGRCRAGRPRRRRCTTGPRKTAPTRRRPRPPRAGPVAARRRGRAGRRRPDGCRRGPPASEPFDHPRRPTVWFPQTAPTEELSSLRFQRCVTVPQPMCNNTL